MKILKIIKNIVYGLLILTVVIIAGFTFLSVSHAPGGIRLFVVQSGSMEPAIKTGAVILVKPAEKYVKDDIISFLISPSAELDKKATTVTHRIAEVHDDEGRLTYTTKGDANEDTDRETVTQRQVLGKVSLILPYLGYIVNFAKTQAGIISLIVIPGTIIVYSEVMSIKKEIIKLIKGFKSKREKRE